MVCLGLWLELAQIAQSEDTLYDSVCTELCVICNMESKICTELLFKNDTLLAQSTGVVSSMFFNCLQVFIAGVDRRKLNLLQNISCVTHCATFLTKQK